MKKQRWTMDDIEKTGLKHSGDIAQENSKSGNKNAETGNKIPKSGIIPSMYALGRLKEGEMNKTEIAYARRLESLRHAGEVLWYAFEPANLKLAPKCFYRVDFLVMVKSGQLECHEVKGYWTDDALVKIKTAAAKFPFRFISAILKKGDWIIKEF